MTYSHEEFADDVLRALHLTVPGNLIGDVQAQADMAVSLITLQRTALALALPLLEDDRDALLAEEAIGGDPTRINDPNAIALLAAYDAAIRAIEQVLGEGRA